MNLSPQPQKKKLLVSPLNRHNLHNKSSTKISSVSPKQTSDIKPPRRSPSSMSSKDPNSAIGQLHQQLLAAQDSDSDDSYTRRAKKK